jgi:hypothetical protein
MPAMPESSHMRLLAHHDLDANGFCGEGTALVRQDGRSFLYVANERGPVNFSVLDVSDPAKPEMVAQPRLPHDKVRSNSLAVGDDLMLVAYQVSEPGLSPAGIEVFDLSNPADPRSIGFLDLSGSTSRGTHWVGFWGGRYAYLASGTPDSRPTNPRDDQFVVVVDLAEPSSPHEVGRWWLPGTQAADDAPPPVRHERFDSGFRPHNINVYPQRPDRAYVGYIDGGIVILDIADKTRPSLVTRLDYHPPTPGMTHTVLPLFERNLLAVTDECLRPNGADYPKLLWFADMSDEQSIMLISSAPLPSLEDHSKRGGRFGAHNLHENEPFEWSWQSEDVVIGTFFNAGVRAFDVRNPYQPVEVAHYVPETPANSTAGVIQMNDIYVDTEGIIYAVDRNGGGLYVLQLEL